MRNNKRNKERKQQNRNYDRRLYFLAQNNVKHWSGTISPAPPCKETSEIESAKLAYEELKNEEGQVIVQPKYMGSYCAVYLTKNIEETKFFSRNGYEIGRENDKRVSREELINACSEIHKEYFEDNPLNVQMIRLEAELLPWSALGKGLIESEYKNYGNTHSANLNFFETHLKKKIEILSVDDFDLENNFFERQWRNLNIFKKDTRFNDIDTYRNSVNKFNKQVELYGSEGSVELKFFNVLSTVFEHGTEGVAHTNLPFEGKIVNSYEELNDYIIEQQNNDMEGVMVKPINKNHASGLPMYKVRFKDYLQLIYGIDFDYGYDYYLQKRRIDKKRNQSIKDFRIKNQLLKINCNDLNEDNSEYMNLLAKAIKYDDYATEHLDKNL